MEVPIDGRDGARRGRGIFQQENIRDRGFFRGVNGA